MKNKFIVLAVLILVAVKLNGQTWYGLGAGLFDNTISN